MTAHGGGPDPGQPDPDDPFRELHDGFMQHVRTGDGDPQAFAVVPEAFLRELVAACDRARR